MEWTTFANISEVFNKRRKGKTHSPGTWPPSHSACSQTTKCWMLHSVQQTKPHQQGVVENMTVGSCFFFSPVGSWFFMVHFQETPQAWTGHYAKVIIWLHGQVEIWKAKHKWFLMVARKANHPNTSWWIKSPRALHHYTCSWRSYSWRSLNPFPITKWLLFWSLFSANCSAIFTASLSQLFWNNQAY